jgi:hypothetical protein
MGDNGTMDEQQDAGVEHYGHTDILLHLNQEAWESVARMRIEIPAGHPLHGEVTEVLKAITVLRERTVLANEIYKMKLPE